MNKEQVKAKKVAKHRKIIKGRKKGGYAHPNAVTARNNEKLKRNNL